MKKYLSLISIVLVACICFCNIAYAADYNYDFTAQSTTNWATFGTYDSTEKARKIDVQASALTVNSVENATTDQLNNVRVIELVVKPTDNAAHFQVGVRPGPKAVLGLNGKGGFISTANNINGKPFTLNTKYKMTAIWDYQAGVFTSIVENLDTETVLYEGTYNWNATGGVPTTIQASKIETKGGLYLYSYKSYEAPKGNYITGYDFEYDYSTDDVYIDAHVITYASKVGNAAQLDKANSMTVYPITASCPTEGVFEYNTAVSVDSTDVDARFEANTSGLFTGLLIFKDGMIYTGETTNSNNATGVEFIANEIYNINVKFNLSGMFYDLVMTDSSDNEVVSVHKDYQSNKLLALKYSYLSDEGTMSVYSLDGTHSDADKGIELITYSPDGLTYGVGSEVVVRAISMIEENPESVKFYLNNGTLLSNDTVAPFEASIIADVAKTYIVKAVATYADGSIAQNVMEIDVPTITATNLLKTQNPVTVAVTKNTTLNVTTNSADKMDISFDVTVDDVANTISYINVRHTRSDKSGNQFKGVHIKNGKFEVFGTDTGVSVVPNETYTVNLAVVKSTKTIGVEILDSNGLLYRNTKIVIDPTVTATITAINGIKIEHPYATGKTAEDLASSNLIVSNVTVDAYAVIGDLSVKSFEILADNCSVGALSNIPVNYAPSYRVKIANNTSESEDAIVIAALYGKDNSLLTVALSETVTLSANSEQTLYIYGDAVQNEVVSAKVMVWDGLGNITPLIETFEY